MRNAWESFPTPPVGELVSGLYAVPDSTVVFAAGREGLARRRGGVWERYLVDTAMTALGATSDGALWVGTSGRGLLRIPKSGDRVEQFGATEGCDVAVVRSIGFGPSEVVAVGEGRGGQRLALWDGERFWSYKVDGPVIEWVGRGGKYLYLGAGQTIVRLDESPDPTAPPSGPFRLTALPSFAESARFAPLRSGIESHVLDELERLGKIVSAQTDHGQEAAPAGRRLDTAPVGVQLPENVTAVVGTERGLLVGTRFVGLLRMEDGVERSFRTFDLTEHAERLTVACVPGDKDECYLATGASHAYLFDGQSFKMAPVDSDPGTRVLAVLSGRHGEVLAIHRGVTDSQLRISQADDHQWTPIGIKAVEVPMGPPSLNFATFAPNGHLWVGLRYVDEEGDDVDYGVAELELDTGKVLYHLQSPPSSVARGFELPNDVVGMYFRSADESWFATRSGAARYAGGQLRIFTENDGLASEIISAIGPGERDETWVTTRHGTGRFDGHAWTFPRLGPYYLGAASLAHDRANHVFLGTEKGVYCVGDCSREPIDSKRGLLDDAVRDLVVDSRSRLWVLTEKGVTVVEP